MNRRTAKLCNAYARRLHDDWARLGQSAYTTVAYSGPSARDVKRAFDRQPAAGRALVRLMMQRLIDRPVSRETIRAKLGGRIIARPTSSRIVPRTS